ncbi:MULTISPECIES: sugar ABC transporter substrate-binding protein [unclassified Mesorhizobium]|uniref:sugar ABC transporter substrate-binding protein n=1 Tax=unclassified Mesorhizobium TaxID=325217 RepID=UPI00112D70AE|nr:MULTISPECIES: sugar ABC transporter substrate-binding protein [unclassified Mesorhizobium]TPM93670.1 sugar ABC transporter substrate-binding protein [Mesorhizobium sp. B2-1-3A]BCG90188.1 sugar ABC transporter substrate-binding protein [Mesorhizobium sp. 113-3-9]
MTFPTKRGLRLRKTVAAIAAGLALGTAALSSASAQEKTVSFPVDKKTIGYVDLIASGAMQRRFYSYFTAGTDALGWKVIFQDAQGDPTKANTEAINLINQGIDALVVSCADSAPMRPALKLAKSKGIPAVQAGCPMTDEKAWDASFPLDDAAVGHALGEYVGKQIGDNAQVGILGDTVILAGKIRTNAVKEGMAGAKAVIVGDQSVNLTDIVGNSRKIVSTYLTANPDLKAILAVYDFFAAPAGNTIKSAGRADKVSVYSFFADAVNVPYMKTEGSPLKAVADGPVEQVGLLAVDQLLGHFKANKPFDSSAAQRLEVPVEIFTLENLPPAGEDFLTPYPVKKYIDQYKEKWTKEYGGN